MAAVMVALMAPMIAAEEEADSMLGNLDGASAGKAFNLQGASGQRRAHGIYFNGR
jgi:hypothetical protein